MVDEEVILLDGESAEWSARDAAHWIGVYTQLIDFCRQAIQSSEAADVIRIRRRLRHLEKRRAFWAGHYKSLT
jgi:hypothetical protein